MALPRLSPRGRVPHHPVFALLYDRIGSLAQRWEAQYREELCAPARGVVLEVGAGTGLNFPHYRTAERVVAAEPEPFMRRRAARRVGSAPVPVEVIAALAEELPFPPATFDVVVCSLALCSVRDLDRAVVESRRVLKSGGALRFYEHVRAAEVSVAGWQDRIERPWGWIAGGCHPNRDTLEALRRVGFDLRFRGFDPPVPGGRLLPHVIGEGRAP